MKIDILKSILPVVISVMLLFSGCVSFDESKMIEKIASLKTLDNETICSFENYRTFVDHVNLLFKLLNREGGYNFQLLKGTREEYERFSKVISEYSPLINNYNEVIYAARNYNRSNPKSVRDFYKALGVFGLEFAIIYASVWYTPSYKIVGKVYRWSGLNKIAFRYPTIVSFILSKAHWGIRGILVEETSDVAKYILDNLEKFLPDQT